ncbi:hypothetical protein [Peribacillus simplex]|uniref:hypothetical protein n=1 Tax=Peribacillus simplex TaxID=1478 RepID=UPI003D07AF18
MSGKSLIEEITVDTNKLTIKAHSTLYEKYLTEDFYLEYDKDIDLNNLDESLLLIPFLLNIAPIIWISGEEYIITKVDKELNDSLLKLKKVFQSLYPSVNWNGSIVPEKITNIKMINETNLNIEAGVLFSGGVDSLCTSFRNYNEKQLLISICGNDIDIKNKEGWLKVEKINEDFANNYGHEYASIKSNFRSFLNNYYLDAVSPSIYNWWAKVQHGMGLIGLTAPLLEIKGVNHLYISSTKTIENIVPWGSLPEIDGNIKWNNTIVSHDGFELNRQDKIREIITAINDNDLIKPIFRVCYSRPLGDGDNCCKCEKCLRTITGLIIEGQDIKEYGFKITEEEAMKLVYKKFSNYKMKINEDLEYVWTTLKTSIKSKNMQLYEKNVVDYLIWLQGFNFNQYIINYKKRINIIEIFKTVIKKNTRIYNFSKKIKSSLVK